VLSFRVSATDARLAQTRELGFKLALDFCYAAFNLALDINTKFSA
jgi:hypothetical protein